MAGPSPEKGQAPAVLILFSDTGGGHRAAAQALRRAIRSLDPAARVTITDPLIVEGRPVVRRLASLYSPLIRRSRLAWGAVYHGTNNRPAVTAMHLVFGRGVLGILAAKIRETRPDVVVSVHPLLNEVAWTALNRAGVGAPLVTVVTDLVDLHRGWLFRRADMIVVPTQDAVDACRRRHVPADRVRLLGLPVDPRFRPAEPGEQGQIRRRMGLEVDRFTILVSGGGEGSGRLLQQIRRLAWNPNPWQVVAVCGRNERLRRRLGRVRFRTPTLVLGFVDNMPELMRAADLVVGKAGPGVIAEAMASQVPIVLTGYLPGQETGNVAYVTRAGAGRYAPTPDELLWTVRDLSSGGGIACAGLALRAAEVARPRAAVDIARECLALAGRSRQEPGRTAAEAVAALPEPR